MMCPESPVWFFMLGMLVDFEVFELSDILEILESKSQLAERVEEAEALITEERAQN
jgi:hypothetical protein